VILAAIVALSRNRVIGRDGDMPWHLPDDLKFFKRTTRGKPVIMGRRTFESIGGALPHRRNIVVSGNSGVEAPDCQRATSLEEALAMVVDAEEVFIIGGGELYRQALPRVQRLYLTEIDAEIPGDTFFPVIHERDWREVWRESHPADPQHPWPFVFRRLERLS